MQRKGSPLLAWFVSWVFNEISRQTATQRTMLYNLLLEHNFSTSLRCSIFIEDKAFQCIYKSFFIQIDSFCVISGDFNSESHQPLLMHVFKTFEFILLGERTVFGQRGKGGVQMLA